MNILRGVPIIPIDELSPFALITTDKEGRGGDARRAVRFRPDRDVMILPVGAHGQPPVTSWSPKFRRFQFELYHRLSAEIPVSKAKEGRYDSRAVPTGWESILYTSGMLMRPRSLPLYSNEGVVAKRKLWTKWQTPRHERIGRIIGEMMSSKEPPRPQSYHGKRRARSGAPFNVADDIALKKGSVLWAAQNWGLVCDLTRQGKLEELARKFYVVYLAIVGGRAQPSDKGEVKDDLFYPKERLIADLLFAITGGKEGQYTAAQRVNVINGVAYAAMRDRLVFAFCYALNTIGSITVVDHRRGVFEEYSAMFLHRGLADIQRKVRNSRLLSLDVVNHDWHLTRLLRGTYWSGAAKHYPDGFLSPLQRLGNPNAYLMAQEDGAICVGDPFKDVYDEHWGAMPSGHFSNIEEGKTCVPTALTITLDDEFGCFGTEEEIDALYRHQSFVQILNMTDDNWASYQDAKLRARLRHALDRPTDFYVSLEYEEAGSFGGFVPYCDHWDSPITQVCHNVITEIRNVLCREHGVDSPASRYWWLGWRARPSIYGDAPMASTAWGLMYTVFRNVYGYDMDEHVSPYVDESVIAMNAATLQFLDNPDSMYYKYLPEEVDPKTMSLETLTYSPEEVQKIRDLMIKSFNNTHALARRRVAK